MPMNISLLEHEVRKTQRFRFSFLQARCVCNFGLLRTISRRIKNLKTVLTVISCEINKPNIQQA